MPMTFRLTDKEQRDIEVKCREINKILINNDHKPIKESELLHEILKLSVSKIEATKGGDIILDD
jgi:hypothetical protein